MMRLGRQERLILRYLWYYARSASRNQNHGYRSQILYAIYSLKHGNDKFSYRVNVKRHIPPTEYNCLQAQITRSTKSLEAKGLLRRQRLRRDFFTRRKVAFFLTEAGFAKAGELVAGEVIRSVPDRRYLLTDRRIDVGKGKRMQE